MELTLDYSINIWVTPFKGCIRERNIPKLLIK